MLCIGERLNSAAITEGDQRTAGLAKPGGASKRDAKPGHSARAPAKWSCPLAREAAERSITVRDLANLAAYLQWVCNAQVPFNTVVGPSVASDFKCPRAGSQRILLCPRKLPTAGCPPDFGDHRSQEDTQGTDLATRRAVGGSHKRWLSSECLCRGNQGIPTFFERSGCLGGHVSRREGCVDWPLEGRMRNASFRSMSS
jgi:hypothetical protein